jgi:AraC-like DNA-binding protein
MPADVRNRGLFMPSSTQHHAHTKNEARLGDFGVRFHPYEYAGPILGTSLVMAGLAVQTADWDIACPEQAQALTLKGIPSTAPQLVIHYRKPMIATRQLQSRHFSLAGYRQFATVLQTGVVVEQPRGPLGMISVRLRPEMAGRLLGERMQDYLDARIGLDDLFGAGQVSLLEEMLAEARTSTERFAHVERFLVANLREHRGRRIANLAAALLQRKSHLRIRHLAARLDVSERHLLRNFHQMFGTSPKRFARVARIERALSARSRGATWADVAYATGFTDQAHMINEFTEIVGQQPAQLVRLPSPLSAQP